MVSKEFFIDIKPFRSHYGAGVDSASNRNEYQDYFREGKNERGVGMMIFPNSCADGVEIWETLSWKHQGLSRPEK